MSHFTAHTVPRLLGLTGFALAGYFYFAVNPRFPRFVLLAGVIAVLIVVIFAGLSRLAR